MKTPNLYFPVYLAALLMLTAVPTEAADVKELFAIDLPDYPGKEGRMIEVSYPPGARDIVHRHDAHAFVYVLEGQIVMQLKDRKSTRLNSSHLGISYAVFCLKKKKKNNNKNTTIIYTKTREK